MSEQLDNMLQAHKLSADCVNLLRQYEAGKITLANGDEVDFSSEQIQALKTAFANARSEGITLWESITG